MTYSDVLKLIKDVMIDVEAELRTSFPSRLDVVNELILTIVQNGGKRIRPAFVALTAQICGYSGPLTAKVGAIMEMVHTASLLHDDVIDEAVQRRGRPSSNVIYGNPVTVLSGDYLYTTAFLNLVKLTDIAFARIVMSAVGAMSEGELLQLQKVGDTSLTMDEYLSIIYGKTAALFSAACECGALLGDSHKQDVMHKYGRNVGYAFQMQDDMLDYFGSEDVIGKKPGTDLAEKKVTLPMLLLLEKASTADKNEIIHIFNSELCAKDKLERLLVYLDKYQIRSAASDIIKGYVNEAQNILESFENTIYKQALVSLTASLNERES